MRGLTGKGTGPAVRFDLVDRLEERFESQGLGLWVAFGRLGMSEVYSMTAVLNEPSQAVMRRLGLTEFARWDHPRNPEGSPLRPSVTYRLTRGAGVTPAGRG